MKAKDYADRYLAASAKEQQAAGAAIAYDLLHEMHELLTARRVTQDATVIAVVRELDLKWRAIVVRIQAAGGQPPPMAGFRACIHAVLPAIYAAMVQQHPGLAVESLLPA